MDKVLIGDNSGDGASPGPGPKATGTGTDPVTNREANHEVNHEARCEENQKKPEEKAGWFDTHCHLDYIAREQNLDEILARASERNVTRLITIATRSGSFEEISPFLETRDAIWSSFGIHPHQAGKEPFLSADMLVNACNGHDRIVALGETGLDFYYDNAPRDTQTAQFKAHLEAAARTHLPIVIHTRQADDDTIELLLWARQCFGPFSGVLHCFSTAYRVAACALELGLYVSFSGIVTFKKADTVREALKKIPLERLVLETDAPFLAPVPHRGRPNEPAFLADTGRFVAAQLGLEPQRLMEITTHNALELFQKTK